MGRMISAAAVLSAALLAAGCNGDGPADDTAAEGTDTIEVLGSDDMAFEPDEFTVAAGEEVSVELTSEDAIQHDFIIEDAADVGEVGEMDMDGDHGTPDSDLEVVHADAGETATGSFTIDEPGTYTLYCAEPGHRAAGMEGTLEVVDAD